MAGEIHPQYEQLANFINYIQYQAIGSVIKPHKVLNAER